VSLDVSHAPLDAFNPFDAALQEDPWAYYARLRREAPVHRDPNTGIYLVSTYALVVEVLKRPEVFSNRFGVSLQGRSGRNEEVEKIAKEGWPPVDTMLTADPPEQRRFRMLVNEAFKPRRVQALEPRMRALTDELIDGFVGDGRAEIRSRFAVLLPLTIIAEQLGVPHEDLGLFKKWSDGFVAQLSQMAGPEAQVEAAKLILEFQKYFAKTLAARAESPKDDIISDLVHARVEGERPLDTAECLSILQQLLVAGNETTASTICEGVRLLATHPDQLAKVVDDPARIPNLVEEVLRIATPTSNMWRVVKEDTELGGVAIPQGSMVLVRFASANRDEAMFPDPDRFDVDRQNAGEHIAFGQGIHFCLGAKLARRELACAFRRLTTRLPGLRLAPDAPPLRHTPSILLRGLEALEIEWDPDRG
jgi:cytochrome P450